MHLNAILELAQELRPTSRMARALRITTPNGHFHIMNRGIARQNIFEDHSDYQAFLKTLQEVSNDYSVCVLAFCLMPNHYHLMVRTPLDNLSRAMRHLGHVYTQRFNRRSGRDGMLFRGRFKSILIESEIYRREVLRYIHLNPVKDGFAADPSLYPYSSHTMFFCPPSNTQNSDCAWYCRREVLNYFELKPGDSEVDLMSRYFRFMSEGNERALEAFYERSRLAPTIDRESVLKALENLPDRQYRHEKNSKELSGVG